MIPHPDIPISQGIDTEGMPCWTACYRGRMYYAADRELLGIHLDILALSDAVQEAMRELRELAGTVNEIGTRVSLIDRKEIPRVGVY